ncbi:hypothetical protein [Brucella rhizosphaerae]|uniref:hypothetical protein n=1 Tax=Brucella rhizosphaerae TaxID=571254 RepID=UPI000466368C|nr:hypothetical protein [Brucella rhizosphaerae]
MSDQAQGAGAPEFTPGPYEVIPTDYPNENDIVSYATDPGIAVAQHVSDKDAPLIAASADLYDALKLADGFLANKGYSESDPLLRGAIRSAIAKARGEA